MPEDIIRFARAYCAEKLPWFAPALFKTKIILTDQIPVAAIDYSFNIYFNPATIQQIYNNEERISALAQIGYVWIHEISHVLREHGIRAQELNADAELWNMAADYEINDSVWDGLRMPRAFPGITPQQQNFPAGQIAEFYYKKLLKRRTKKKGKMPQNGMDEGSGVHGQARPWEVTAQTTGEAQQLTDVEIKMIKKSVAQEMQRARAAIGNLPGNWAKWIDDTLRPKVNWHKVLSHRMSMAINTGLGSRIDYTFTRPSRRQAIYNPILTPSLRGDLAARIAVVVDTSGSMSAQQLGQAMAEVSQVLKTFQIPVTIIPCDVRAYEPIRLNVSDNVFSIQQMTGGGGTDMRVGIAAALQLKPAPDSILVLTDGFTPYPAKRYKTPVIFGILSFGDSVKSLPPNPPFGKDVVIEIELEK
ncbi:MAG: VWA-like domain-containing protein [Saprospiraceae bacterium]